MTNETLVLLGVIGAPHGIKGQVKITTYTESPENLTAYGALTDKTGKKQFNVHIERVLENHVIARIEGCLDRTAVEKLRGQELYVPRDRLPKLEDGEFYIEDLIGLLVKDNHNFVIGEIISIQNFGAGNVVEMKTMEGKNEFHAFDHFHDINIEDNEAILSLPETLIAEEKP